MDLFLLVDKPIDWTSFQVVKKIKHILMRKYQMNNIKVGHSGTLDPKATGLMIVGTGRFTKKMEYYKNFNKTYIGTIKLGASTPTLDIESNENQFSSIDHINIDSIYNVANNFNGIINQKPPIFSSIKIQGKRAYEYARKGISFNMKSRNIFINYLSILNINLPFIDFEIECSKGTYIRSIAEDFGKRLGTLSYLVSLRRIKIGEYNVNKAINIDNIYNNL